MHDEFIHPNWHVILIHFPLGLLGVGVVIELLSFLWRRSGFRIAGHWMILIGALACLPSATSGIYAFHDVVTYHTNLGDDASWGDIKIASHWNDTQWHLMRNHVLFATIGALVIALTACAYLSA